MPPFRVWLRPLGEGCRVRVEGSENAAWLLDRVRTGLKHVQCDETIGQDGQGISTLVVHYASESAQQDLDRLLSRMPELQVMFQPA